MYEIMGSTTCGYCDRAKETLDRLGIGYVFKIVDEDIPKEVMRERVFKATGQYPETIPQIFVIATDEYVGGYDDLADRLLEEGYTYQDLT